jgi:hypothetical protein
VIKINAIYLYIAYASTYDWMANKARRTLEDVLDVRARDRRPKLPPPVAQSGRAGAGVEREAEARPVA